ncbi:unnamed protein product [Gongylonema pulchrum]|uniref:Integrase n=1 Tax=Gongylonema pulchrum TaxID=637853 RepID=A0A183DLM4_9BILA|nr:unnamed protein product [Gongylonema pulchrum]
MKKCRRIRKMDSSRFLIGHEVIVSLKAYRKTVQDALVWIRSQQAQATISVQQNERTTPIQLDFGHAPISPRLSAAASNYTEVQQIPTIQQPVARLEESTEIRVN